MKKVILIFLLICLNGCSNEKLKCPENYELKGRKCIAVVEEQLITKKTCNEGYQLIDDKCIKETIVEPKKEYSCEKNYNIIDGECVTFLAQVAPIISRTCQEGYKLEGSNCVKHISYTPWTNDGFSFWCNKGGNLVAGVGCVTSTTSIPAIPTYGKCPDGFNSAGPVCTKNDKKAPSEILKCENNYNLENNNCVKRDYVEPVITLTCNDGFKQVGDVCLKEITIKPTK